MKTRNLDTLFYRNRRLLVMVICLILVAGISSYHIVPRMEDPEMVQRWALVKSFYPGASAERTESLVTEKIEEKIAEIEELKYTQSTTSAGVSTIKVELKEEVPPDMVEGVWARIRNKLKDVAEDMPRGATEPVLEDLEARAHSMIVALTWERKTRPNYSILRRRAKLLEKKLKAVRGTEKIYYGGEPEEEIRVVLHPEALAALSITAADVSRQIEESDAKLSAGRLRSEKNQLLIEVESELQSIERIRRIPIATGKSGEMVYLGRIAKIKKGVADPPSNFALVDGKAAVTVAVNSSSNTRIDHWAFRIHRELKEYRANLSEGVGLQVIFDQSGYTEARLSQLMFNLMLGSMLVALVVLFMLGWRSAFIISLSLPLTALMVFTGMRFLKIPIHQMSVTGLILALGLLIDNAIVMVDEVQMRLKEGKTHLEAISESVRQLAIPLLGSTLTTAFAFTPLAIMPGGAGEFVGTIAISVILSLFSSLFLSLTVISSLTAILHGDRLSQGGDRRWWRAGFSHPRLTAGYQWTLDRLFDRPILGVLLGLCLPVLGFIHFGDLKEQFFPPADRDQLQIELELPAFSSLSQTKEVIQEARKILLQSEEVTQVHWFGGKSAPSFYYNIPRGKEQIPHYAQALVQLKGWEKSREVARKYQRILDEKFPQARILVRQLEQGPPFDAPVELRIFGPDFPTLQRWGDRVRRELMEIPHVIHTRADLGEPRPKLELRLDEERARATGLDYTVISQQLNSALEGIKGGSVLEATEELPVRVRISNYHRGTLDQIASLNLISPRTGEYVPLSSLGEIHLVPQLSTIYRRNRKRYNTVQAFVTAGVLPSVVLGQFKERWEELAKDLPPGYTYTYGGESAERDQAVGHLMSSVGILLVLMIITLVMSFDSFKMAGIIGAVGFLSVGLGLMGLWVFGFPFGFMAIVGTMGLIGVAINDSIVVLAAIQEHPQAREGDPQAMRKVVVRSTRHVLATTVTTIAGFTPLLLDGGGFWPPMAISIAGGVAGATILALYFSPSAYLLLECPSRKCRQKKFSSPDVKGEEAGEQTEDHPSTSEEELAVG